MGETRAKSRYAKRNGVPHGKAGRVRRATAKQEHVETKPVEDVCIGCGGPLLFTDEARLCPKCNTERTHELAAAIASGTIYTPNDEDQRFIECPGSSIYDESTGAVIEGADFIEREQGAYEVRIIKHGIYPPGHRSKRLVSQEQFGKIRRCQACQDYTVRLRRKEGVDFCVPSRKFPHRTKLKSVDIVSHNASQNSDFQGQ